ncbi:MAG TPA: polymer-forming cytoskeletal protein [Spirochaetota bacterium]|nr:polymer-forming cytoskeletal protein [Spirochaetota bacterium]HNT10759.1 polymer-forming cytoskeletal protein [Spirochaetota bacterium]HNV49289.1 polymer-forming cytoskeletal protein [Spirochaetota bacterium]HOS41790.1 polymer-forming cytoskeletal protein [Spirochaetota bacterium]HPU88792.1 polymer-forming cytoskeletal protein [Spirochaetota bacterium]
MADSKEMVEDENKIGTVIGDDIEFRGTLSFKKSLKIKGFFEGKIETDGHLLVGQDARVSADIRASVVSVNGRVNGTIKADKKVELFSDSVTMADIIAPDLSIESGSSFNGVCVMNGAPAKE